MLSQGLVGQMRGWRFALPLPPTISTRWTARVTFRLDAGEDNLEDAVDGPPWYPCCGDMITVSPAAAAIKGTLEGEHGERIDLKPSAAAPVTCSREENTTVPVEISQDDYIDLDRRRNYRLRVYRSGLIDWSAPEDSEVVIKGNRQFSMPYARADDLFRLFSGPAVWSDCGIDPPRERDDDGDVEQGEYLTVHIGDRSKTINLWASAPQGGMSGSKLSWAVDSAANSHQWRHGDSIGESFRRMADDLHTPKPGITALMRAADHYNSGTAQWTDVALKYQIGKGADVEATDDSGWTALMYAAGLHGACCDDRAVRLLLEAHANPNHAGLHGETPLMAVAYEGYLSESLLKAGADINARNGDGVTVLMLLAQQFGQGSLEAAIEAGADANAADAPGRTALDYLREAACGHAIVPLSETWMKVICTESAPCTSGAAYLKSKALLEAAMKKQADPKQR